MMHSSAVLKMLFARSLTLGSERRVIEDLDFRAPKDVVPFTTNFGHYGSKLSESQQATESQLSHSIPVFSGN